MGLIWRPGFQFDVDASNYIEAVEAADTQALETGVRYAINNFVIGCKQDGIWDAIKASCILAGARTLAGALVPLVGTAPTNNNFVAGDYNRKTGLVGDGSTKYLNSNRAGNADPQNSVHAAVWRSDTTALSTEVLLGSQQAGGIRNVEIYAYVGSMYFAARKASTPADSILGTNTSSGFLGVSRSSSTAHFARATKTTLQSSFASVSPSAAPYNVFADNNNGSLATPTVARLAFYSIGESLDLAKLDARVTDLITAIGAAIP